VFRTTVLHCDYSRFNERKHFFCNRIVDIWNALKISSGDIDAIRTFKKFSKTVDFSEYLNVSGNRPSVFTVTMSGCFFSFIILFYTVCVMCMCIA